MNSIVADAPQSLHAPLPISSRAQFEDAPTIRIIGGETQSRHLDSIFKLRYRTYCLECEFLSADRYPDKLESDEYDADSVHFSTSDHFHKLLGTVRLVLGKEARPFPLEINCKFNDSFSSPGYDKIAEISRLIINSSLRRRHNDHLHGNTSRDPQQNSSLVAIKKYNSNQILLFALYRAIVECCMQKGITFLYAAMEKSLARSLQRTGFVFIPIGPEAEYYGRVTPYILDLSQLEKNIAHRDPELAKWVFQIKSFRQ